MTVFATCSACAARPSSGPTASELAAEQHAALGFRSLEPRESPTNVIELRAQTEDRRHELLDQCNAMLTTLEDQRSVRGPLGVQVLTGLAAGAVAAATAQSVEQATGTPQQHPLPVTPGVNLAESVALRNRIARLRAHMHTVIDARSTGDILVAMDALRPDCVAH